MAMPKSRIAVIIVLTVLGAALFVVVLHSRWRATTAINISSQQRLVSSTSESSADVNKKTTGSVLAGSKYWNKAINVVESLIRDKLKSDPRADPDLLATWQRQVSNQKPSDESGGSVKKTSPESPLDNQQAKQKVIPPPTVPTVRKDLPFLTRGSVEIRPERIPPPAHSSDIYISLLTAPKFHDTRISLQYLTWLQAVDPKQV